MVNIKFYLISYDQCAQRAVQNLTKDEIDKVYCYAVNSQVPKIITAKVKVINEWQLKWYNVRYQTLQYYEYGTIVHCVKNPELIEGLTHIGIFHNDVLFAKNSVNDMIAKLEETPNKIFYMILRKNDVLYFSKEQLKYIADYLSPKLNVNVDANKIWDEGWICESMAVMPINVFTKFGEFILKYQYDIENILHSNSWGIMNIVKHRLCGFVERLWGIYLVSCEMPIEQMNVIHDRDQYFHQQEIDKEKHLRS